MKINRFSIKRWLSMAILMFFVPVIYGLLTPEEMGNPVKIGLLIQEKESLAAVEGASLAISSANKSGGLRGRPFELVVRSMEGSWGTGSKQAVDLIFEENVWALIGSHDGRNAHLVEQAATKAQVVFVSAWSGDPTLSQAFVPWFFNAVPNDLQQADALIEEIYIRRKIDKILLISDRDYDSKQALNSFLREIKSKTSSDPVQLSYEDLKQNFNSLSRKIEEADAGTIILFCKPSVSVDIFRQIRQQKINMPVFGSLSLVNEDELSEQQLEIYDNDLLIPSGIWTDPKSKAFIKAYRERFGRNPGMVAAHAFDSMDMIIEAIKITGSGDREKIQKALYGLYHQGVTGMIKFDNLGNRSDKIQIISLRKGIPAAFIL